MQSDRFLKLAQSAQTEEQHNLFLSQHYRYTVRSQINQCSLCPAGQGGHIGFQGKTPSFVTFITMLPMRSTAAMMEFETQLNSIGYRPADVCWMSMVACEWSGSVGSDRFQLASICHGNLVQQMQLSSSRVFVLMGLDAASLLFGSEPKNMQDIRGEWLEQVNGGQKQWWFVTENPAIVNGNKVMQGLLREDFTKLASLLHYAWAVHMTELYPQSGFEHQLTYEQICDVVANDVKQALLDIPPGQRSDEYMRIMLRIVRDPTGLAARAFWDDEMARKCGVDLNGRDSWIPNG